MLKREERTSQGRRCVEGIDLFDLSGLRFVTSGNARDAWGFAVFGKRQPSNLNLGTGRGMRGDEF